MSESKVFSSIALMAVAAIWGSAFLSMKGTLERLDVNSFLTWRFVIATLLLIAIRPSVLKKIDLPFLKKGVILGLFLSSGYIFQSFGLTLTTVSNTGFITGLYVVFTPVVAAVILRKNITLVEWFAVLVATVGLALLSFNGVQFGVGEFLVLIGALLFAFHIVGLGEWSKGLDTYALTVIQLGTCAVVTFLASFKSGFKAPPDSGVWWSIIYTAIFATALAFIVQTWAQSFIAPSTVGVILAAEVVFAAAFGIWLLNEPVTLRIALGGLLVLASMYLIILLDQRKESAKS
ncbi:MAG: DMT family transporter [Actinobacteria bacterium]|nr:DMT family transporter [Actinomycetota bacterium]MDA2981246.1 DMT family transporter [Actinomycetota bacterium]MDA2996168.1 DMT family transporter [Actinomycetota bacterium]